MMLRLIQHFMEARKNVDPIKKQHANIKRTKESNQKEKVAKEKHATNPTRKSSFSYLKV